MYILIMPHDITPGQVTHGGKRFFDGKRSLVRILLVGEGMRSDCPSLNEETKKYAKWKEKYVV
jgi:hypothetical protein